MDHNAYQRRRLELQALTRRDVLKRGVAGAGIFTAGGFIAACGGSRAGGNGSSGGGSPSTRTTTGKVKQGGTLVFAIDALTGNSDPGIFATFGDWMAIDCIARGLTHIDYHTTEVKPALAEHWDISQNGTIYRFQLRKGLKFHDGNPVTAKDCARSFNRLIDDKDPSRPKGTYAIAELGGTNVRKATAISDTEFELKLGVPDVAFLARLSNPNGVILSEAAIEKYGNRIGNHLVAAGPFEFAQSTPGQSVTLKAFDGYWEGRPPIDKLVLQVLPDPSALASALQGHSVQASNFIPESNAKQLSGSVHVYEPRPYIDIFLQMNAGVPLLRDLRVRQAINLALDRKAIVSQGFAGLAQEPAYMVAPPELGYDASLKQYSTQDMAKAKQLLREAGAVGKTVSVIHQNLLFWPKVGQIVNSNLQELGLKVKTQFLDSGTFSSRQFDPKGHEIATWQRSAFVPDPDNKLSPLLAGDSSPAQTITQNPLLPTQKELDRMLVAARQETDSGKRGQMYVELQRFLAEKVMVYSMLANIFTPVAAANDLANFNADSLGTYRLFLEKTGYAA
jgi:peptide/nickel transport system substrate-binding protein